MSTCSSVWYKTPVGLLQLRSWKGQNTSGSTTGPFCPSDWEIVARILKNSCGLGGYGAGSQAATFWGESIGNDTAHLALSSDSSKVPASPCWWRVFLWVCPLWTLASWLNSKINIISHNTLGGLSPSYSVQPQFTHSSSDILQFWHLRNCLSFLGRIGRGARGTWGCGGIMLFLCPFLSWNSPFWIWKSCSVWGSWEAPRSPF